MYGQNPSYLTERFPGRCSLTSPLASHLASRSDADRDDRRRDRLRRHLAVQSKGARSWFRNLPCYSLRPRDGNRGGLRAAAVHAMRGHDHRTGSCARYDASVSARGELKNRTLHLPERALGKMYYLGD
jgi:hypothetical protein